MTVVYGGSLTLGQCIPTALTAQGHLVAALNLSMPDFQARLDGLLALSISPPPALADLIAAATAALAALQALLADPLPDITLTLSLLGDFQFTMGQLTLMFDFALGLGLQLGTPGIHYYAFAGRANELATQMSAQLSAGLPGGAGPNETIAGVVLLASDGGAIAALQAVMGI